MHSNSGTARGDATAARSPRRSRNSSGIRSRRAGPRPSAARSGWNGARSGFATSLQARPAGGRAGVSGEPRSSRALRTCRPATR